MDLNIELFVSLKGSDLVASTAYLALTGKMGYGGKLIALSRFDYFSFLVKGGQAEENLSRLKRALSSQSTFYNRNKHYYSLECRWKGGSCSEGFSLEFSERKLLGEISKYFAGKKVENLDRQKSGKYIILEKGRLYKAEVLVERADAYEKEGLAGRLSSDLPDCAVSFRKKGTLWWMVLSAPGQEEAKALLEEISVSRTRSKGLLLNPNYQSYRLISLREMEIEKHV